MNKTLTIVISVFFTYLLLPLNILLGIEKNETITRTMQFSDANAVKEIVVDNVNGFVEIIGTNRKDIYVDIKKHIQADSEMKYRRAIHEVTLDISEINNTIEFYVDGPFRERNRTSNYRGLRHPGYKVIYNFRLEIPAKTNLYVKTVTDGYLFVKNISGEFELHNVNGGIDMIRIDGSGVARTVNGDIHVGFLENPQHDCSVGSINGEIKIYFQKPLSADFRLKTFNGDVFSDFEVSFLPSKGFTKVRKNRKTIYKCDQTTGFKAGSGGPEISIDTLNGDIFILNAD